LDTITNICNMILTTKFKAERLRRDRRLYADFIRMTSEPGASVTEATRVLMERYGLHSPSTVWAIRRRMERGAE